MDGDTSFHTFSFFSQKKKLCCCCCCSKYWKVALLCIVNCLRAAVTLVLAPWLCGRVQASFLYSSCVAIIDKFSFSGMLIISNVFQRDVQVMKSRNQQTELFPTP